MEADVRYKDTIIQNQTSSPIDFDRTIFSTLTLEEEKDNPINHPNFIPITIKDKTRLYEETILNHQTTEKAYGYNLLHTKLHKF